MRLSVLVFFVSGVLAACGSTSDPWRGSEWISVASAPVLGKGAWRQPRAADGTSCFWRRVANAKAVKSVRWITTGLGVYELYVNGLRIGDDALKPGYTNNDRTKYAFSYDVTSRVRPAAGETNDFGAEVSAGWWRDQIAGYRGKKSAFRCLIELVYEDGTEERIGTQAGEWQGAVAGPVTHAGIFDGEEFDARQTNAARRPPVDFAPGGCERNDEFRGEILPTDGAEVVLRRDLATAMTRGPFVVRPGRALVVDFGQNCAAVPHFTFRARRGATLTVLFGAMLNDADGGRRGCDGPKGSVYRANLRIPEDGMRVRYTFAGDDWETYVPRFSFFGYRYASLEATDEVEIKSVSSVPVTSITREMETGSIVTGDPSVNRLISNVRWGQLSNYLSVPTDCPQRNERQGWAADTQVFAEAGSFLVDTRAFFRKWMRDMRDGQSPNGSFPVLAPSCGDGRMMRFGWADAGVIVPYVVWRHYGDRRIVEENWTAMERFMRHVDETRYETEAVAADSGRFQYGDWLSFEPYESCSGRAFEAGTLEDREHPKPETVLYWDYLGGCYWLSDARMMAEMARGVGRDARPYERMADAARAYLRKRFFATDDGRILPCFRAMQTPALFALRLGLVAGDAKTATVCALRQNFRDHGDCLQTGFLGTSILMDTLAENGLADVAWTLLLQHECPSWLHAVDQGATTIWERWNSYTKKDGFGPVDMNSFNHYAYGAVLAWLYKTVAGIASDPAHPGFATVVMKPMPDRRLGFVRAEYRSAAGLVRSAWRYEGEKWIWDFSVPEGATASVTLPGEAVPKAYPAGSHHVERCAKP